MKLWVYVIRRLIILIPTLLGLTFLMFGLTHVGGTNLLLSIYINPHLSGTAKEEAIKALVARFHLNDPIFVQYFYWLAQVLQGDLGTSVYAGGIPVSTAIVLFMPDTLLLTMVASILTWIIAIPMGVYSAVRRDSVLDQTIRVSSFTLYSMPFFMIGFIVLIVFGLEYPIVTFPIGNLNPILYLQLKPLPWWDSLFSVSYPTHILVFDAALHGAWNISWDAFLHSLLPSISLTLALLAGIVRILRSSMLEVLDQDYIRLARAKGVPERFVFNLHAKKNALLPTVTSFGYLVAGLLGGVVVIEDIFNYKGIGWWTTQALLQGDTAAILGSTFVFGIILVVTTLVLDILYAVLDPRIRY
jgi:ABC-type dipeptide/oligopeptide/nickel transport system permease component